jgi:aminoglycoside 6-adenylyltransferase
MRTATQVLDQLLSFARDHDTIRAVTMNGSRVNPNAPKDIFCDYDVVYFTTNPRSFLDDQSWIASFGELIILQQNDFTEHGLDGYIFLMLFSDGVRIDLAFDPLEYLPYLGEDSLTRVLLDKDGRIPALPPASDCGYFTQRPTREVFDETVNEVFWCANNIAKGIWRDELAYAKYMFDEIVRPCVRRMLEWYAAMLHGWAITTGAYGKWLKKYLPPEIWDLYAATYAGADYEANWEALFKTCLVVRRTGMALAEHLGYTYPLDDDRRMVAYLERVRRLPPTADDYDVDHPGLCF